MGLIDDFVSNIGKEVNKVQSRSQEMLQSFNLQNQIRDIERKKTAKLLEIGRLIYDKYHKDADVSEDTLKEKVAEVAGCEQEINVMQSELDNIKSANDPETPQSKRAETKAGFNPTPGYDCPRCHAPAARDKNFCPTCGEPLKKRDGDGGSDAEDIVDVEPNGNDD